MTTTSKQIAYPTGARSRNMFETHAASVASRVVSASAPEEEFQQLVLDTARANGWRSYHTLRSDGSTAGYPDLSLVRGRRLLFIELKKVGKAPSMEQVRWLLALAAVPGVEAYVFDATDTDTMMAVLA